jgi:predicted nucleic acid-binding protein
MAWVVDTSVLLDVRARDPVFGPASQSCLQGFLPDGLLVCPVTFVELAPTFLGDREEQERWFIQSKIAFDEGWLMADTVLAHELWYGYVRRKRRGEVPKRPVADALIAAFALRFQGIITRNRSDFTAIAPALNIVEP